ncbi:uncharacterized protein I303_104297 [Kwoniella dejecticola CBS 10117]|uniref:BZIP domain-containing protein n=1 Tax=Kwoniella dejecticola CBS 10117 TaxID=1296121 RepID=A0A1A6A5Q9_9TREE|nr:uncharacterized protein I303_04728 [Kwoniella dejecticola CBS 10117]OBR85393.1 hypothetical protein I303_04728 [Kwoniella dejecticola CBS 10117]
MSRQPRHERRLAPLPPPPPSQPIPNVGLSFLADTALADAVPGRPMPPQRKGSITLPPIAALIPVPCQAANPPSLSSMLPRSGSSIPEHSHAHTATRSASARPARKSDQPVLGNEWANGASTSDSPSNTHMSSVSTPFPPRQPSKKERSKKQSQSHNRATPASIPLEYNVRPYNRLATTGNPAPARTIADAPLRTQPSRPSKTKLPHPLQGLALDKTYPERKVEDWHNDAQNMLRPPVSRPYPTSSHPELSIDHHSAAQALIPPPPPPPHTLKKVHPPVESWDRYALPQMPGDQSYLPQLQHSPVQSRPHSRRHQSTPSVAPTNATWDEPFMANNLPQSRIFAFIPENPEMLTRSRHRNIISIGSQATPNTAMQRSQSAHSNNPAKKVLAGKASSAPSSPKGIPQSSRLGGSLPTPVTGCMEMDVFQGTKEWLAGQTRRTNVMSTFQEEVLSLPQVQTPSPPLPEIGMDSPINVQFQSEKFFSPQHREATTPIDQEMRDDSSAPPPPPSCSHSRSPESTRSHQQLEEPGLASGDSSYSESCSEPASDEENPDEQIERIRTDDQSDDQFQESSSTLMRDQADRRSSSARAQSDSHFTQHSDFHSVKSDNSLSSSPTSSCFSPTTSSRPKNAPKRTKTNSASGSKANVKGTKPTGGTGQRKNGERRREQNAVAQKKFRWKKKQQAAKMEEELEISTALVSTLKKEGVEKDRLINKLKGEVGVLKRKLKHLDT